MFLGHFIGTRNAKNLKTARGIGTGALLARISPSGSRNESLKWQII